METLWTPSDRLSRIERRILWVLPLCALLTLTLLRWQQYGDVQVDLGRELYVPWQILEGQHLYRDIPYTSGPFSPHVHALIMSVFGVSLRTLVFSNIVVIACTAYLILWFVRRATVLCLGTVASSAFIIVFAFSAGSYANVFNFITPYVHELPHGILLSLMSMFLLETGWDRRKNILIACAGGLVGLALLTRIEIAFAIISAMSAWWWCVLHQKAFEPVQKRFLLVFLLSIASVITLSAVVFHYITPESDVWRSLFASFYMVYTTPIMHSPLFRYIGGWDTPAVGIGMQLIAGMIFLFLLIQCYASALMMSLKARVPALLFGGLGISCVIALAVHGISPLLFGSVLLLSTFGIFMVVMVRLCTSTPVSTPLRLSASATLFALAMLTKILLTPKTYFYGFAHGMTAYLLFMVVFLSYLPTAVQRRLGNVSSKVFACLLAMIFLMDIGVEGVTDQKILNNATLAIGTGPNKFFVADNTRNRPYRDFLAKAPNLIPPSSTMVVLPEGVLFNVLLRIPSTTHTTHYTVSEYIMFGRSVLERSLQQKPPDFVLLTHKDSTEFGFPIFGKMPEYGADVMTWLKREYEQIALFGQQPLTRIDSEGVALWRRKDFLTNKREGM